MRTRITYTFASVLFIILLNISCNQCVNREKYRFDFTPFKEKGWINDNNKKYLTYLKFSSSRPEVLYFFCEMGFEKLKPLRDSNKLDILCLIKTEPKDTAYLYELLKSNRWCFEHYIVTFEKQPFFGPNVGVGYLFDKDWTVIAMTNPSLDNFFKYVNDSQ